MLTDKAMASLKAACEAADSRNLPAAKSNLIDAIEELGSTASVLFSSILPLLPNVGHDVESIAVSARQEGERIMNWLVSVANDKLDRDEAARPKVAAPAAAPVEKKVAAAGD